MSLPLPCPTIPPLPCTPDPKQLINAAQQILPILNTVFTDKNVATNLRNIMLPISPYIGYLKNWSISFKGEVKEVLKYTDGFLKFGYTPRYNLLDYMTSINKTN